MRKALFEVAAAVAAGVIAFAVITLTADLRLWVKWTVVAGVVIFSFGIATLADRRLERQKISRSIAVGTDINSKDRVRLEDIKVSMENAERAEIGSRIRSKLKTDIKGVEVRGRDRDDKRRNR